MSIPRDPQDPTYRDPLDAAASPGQTTPLEPATAGSPLAPTVTPAVPAQPVAATPPISVPAEQSEESGQGVPSKVKVAALAAGAAALANKVRKEAPKKIREAREKSVAGRWVVLTEVNGRPVAIGPYRKEEAARQDATRVTGAQEVVELRSRAAHFGPPDSESTTQLP